MIVPVLIAAASLAGITSPALAPAEPPAPAARNRTTTTDTYRARYEPHRDVYCIRIFDDPAPAEPYPGATGETCQSRARWATEGLTITDPRHDTAASAGKS